MQKLSVGSPNAYSNQPDPVATPEMPLNQNQLDSTQTATVDSLFQPMAAEATTSRLSATQKGNQSMKKSVSTIGIVVIGVALAAGTLTGLGAARLSAKSGNPLTGTSSEPISQIAGDTISNGDVFGAADAGDFKDPAEGYLEIGGLDGEGSHKLIREGGVSQTVYLTSSVTDLSKFDGMQVKVWGETFKAQKAGWLMDVGRVQVVNTQGTKPE